MNRPGIAFIPIWARLLVGAIVAAVALLWPLPANLTAVTLDTGDALHEAAVIAWVQRNLASGGDLFAAATNYPYTQAIFINPPLYTSAVLGLPLFWLGWSPAAVYNALTLASFVLGCWAMGLLGYQLTRSSLAGMVAGIGYAFASVRMAHLVHLNLISGYWTILLLWLLVRLWQAPPQRRWSRAALCAGCGLATAAQVLADVYNGIFLLAALLLFGVYQLATRRWGLPWRATLALGASMGLAALLCLAVLVPTLHAWRSLETARSLDDHERYGARLEDYLTPAHPSALGYDLSDLRYSALAPSAEQIRWPGLVTLGLAALGLAAARRAERQEQGYFALLALTALLLSFGPTIRFNDAGPALDSPLYRWLAEHVPLFAAARVPSRWALLGQVGLAALAAYGVAALARLGSAWQAALHPGAAAQRRADSLAIVAASLLDLPDYRIARHLLPLAVAALLVIDVWGPPVRGTTAVAGEPLPAVYAALAELPPGPLLEWPLENMPGTLAHRYEYYSLFHGRPIVNSASSVVPERYHRLHNLLRAFPSDASVTLLRDLGVRYVNINRYELGNWGEVAAQLHAAPGLRRVGVYEEGRHYLYEVLAAQPALPPSGATIVAGAAGPELALHLAGPLWLDNPARYYAPDQPATLTLRRADGAMLQHTLRLPPGLLPGIYRWPLPAEAAGAVALELNGQTLPLLPTPEQLVKRPVAGPQLVAQALPATVTPNGALACRVYGKGPLAQPGLVFSVNLVDADWNVIAKRDHFFEGALPPHAWDATRFTPLACGLTLPANLPPGDYFLAIGLFDPAQGQFVPFAGPDGVQVAALWRIPTPIQVAPARLHPAER